MPVLRYPLEPDGSKRLELAWEGQYEKFTIKLDGHVVGQVPSRQALAAGHSLPLPDGSTLTLKTAGTALANELRVLRDGRPVPGSASDPAMRLRNTYQFIFFIAGVNLVLGALAGLGVDFLAQLGLGWGSAVIGAVYLVLGLMVRLRSLLALLLTLLLYGLETIMAVAVPLLTTSGPNVTALLVRAVVLWFLFQGVPAIRQLQPGGAGPAAPKAG